MRHFWSSSLSSLLIIPILPGLVVEASLLQDSMIEAYKSLRYIVNKNLLKLPHIPLVIRATRPK